MIIYIISKCKYNICTCTYTIQYNYYVYVHVYWTAKNAKNSAVKNNFSLEF